MGGGKGGESQASLLVSVLCPGLVCTVNHHGFACMQGETLPMSCTVHCVGDAVCVPELYTSLSVSLCQDLSVGTASAYRSELK